MKINMPYDISLKNNRVDYLLSLTASFQSVFSLLQLFLMDVLYMDAEKANMIRVISTAIPILLSMIAVLRRKFMLTMIVYTIVLSLLMTGFMIPGRWEYMKDDVLKFTIPVVVPIGLCVVSVRNFPVLIKSIQYMSIIAAMIGFLYAVMYLLGIFIIDRYSMSFSYALMFPTFVFIARKHIIWKGIALLLIFEMLAIGSRGALILSVSYWIFTILWGKLSFSKLFGYIVCLFVVYKLFFGMIVIVVINIFESIGIQSRTLQLLLEDELVSHDSGRSDVYHYTWKLIEQAPLFGSGVWADRQYLGYYCHNIFLELLVDYGFIGAGLILIVFAIKQLKIYRKIQGNYKAMYILMFGIVCPLFVSDSYLNSYNLGMFLGFSYLISKLHDNLLYQDVKFE